MSKLERTIQTELEQLNIKFVQQEKIPVKCWPWKRPRSHKPKCDFFLPDSKIYVEVKGFMTIHAMAKMSWFARQSDLRYYILQGTEEDWNPYIDSPQGIERSAIPESKQKIRDQSISHQAQELAWLARNDPAKASALSLARLKDYIGTRISEYKQWNGEWY